MRPDSDIDFLVEFLPGAKIDLVDYAGLMLELSKLIGRKVDLECRRRDCNRSFGRPCSKTRGSCMRVWSKYWKRLSF